MRTVDVVASFEGEVGAYVHIPFCRTICPFCPYNKVVADDELARRYFAALRREIDWYVDAFGQAGRLPFTSLYIGGGTPTLYPDALADIVGRIPVSGERAIEVLPNHATEERLDRLAAMGVTAVSIGAQSFHEGALRQLRRPHDAATSRAAVEHALGRFACVDVDLIVDVAWEDDESLRGAFLDDVRTCLELGVDQVSTYPLMRFGYTPFGTARHDRRAEHEVLARATQIAEEHGYERRSVWTFNRKGSAAYTSITRRRFLGMGAGSSSFGGRDFAVNHFGVTTYCEAVERGDLPIARWLHLGRCAGAAYDVFWEAYAGGVDRHLVEQSYGWAVAATVSATLAPLVPAGLLRPVPSGYRLTRRGFDAYHDLERIVTYQLIEPLWAEMLAEHLAEPGAAAGRARWVTTQHARKGRAWALARRLFARPRPKWRHHGADSARIGRHLAGAYDAAVGLVGWHRLQDRLLADVQSGLVLDVGCGPAHPARRLRARGVRYVGVDRNGAMLAKAAGGAVVVRADITALPFANGAFDVVTTTGVLGLLGVEFRRRALGEMARVARHDVRLIEPVHRPGQRARTRTSRVVALLRDNPIEPAELIAAGLDPHIAGRGHLAGAYSVVYAVKRRFDRPATRDLSA